MTDRFTFFLDAFRQGAWRWALCVGWVAALAVISSLPGGSIDAPEIVGIDKVFHFGFFFVGGGVFALAAGRSWKLSGWRLVVRVALVVTAFGILDEWRQMHVPGRSGGDVDDLLADALGAFCGAWTAARWGRL